MHEPSHPQWHNPPNHLQRRPARFLGHFLARFPLWPVLSGLLPGIWAADSYGTCIAGYLLTGCGVLLLLTRNLTGVLFVLALLAGYGQHTLMITRQLTWTELIEDHSRPLNCTLTGTIIDPGPRGQGPCLIKVTTLTPNNGWFPTSAPDPSGLRVMVTGTSHRETKLHHGDRVRFSGRIEPIQAPRNPYGFDRREWLHRQGCNLTMTTDEPVSPHGTDPLHQPLRRLSIWREQMRATMTAGLERNAAETQLICAVVLGERPPQPSAILDDFRNSGTLHVFAVSGLHVGMVGAIIGALLWWARAPRWLLITAVITGMTIYAGITGFRPPATRAVIMASVFLIGFLLRRQPSLINSLAASAIVVLIWDSHQIFTPGFQLSYGVLLALALTTRIWLHLLKPVAEIDPFMPRLLLSRRQEKVLSIRKWLRNSLAVSLSAWTGSAPLTWVHFGIITPVTVLAGIPLMLLVFVILALAMLGIATGSLIEPVGKTVNQSNALVARAANHLANRFARIPGGHWHRQAARPAKGRIIVFDIPKGGGAHYLDMGGGVLLDSGREDHFLRHVLPALNHLKARPDSLIISHADAGHCGGMPLCLDLFHPKQALIPRSDSLSKSYLEFIAHSDTSHCKTITPQTGQYFRIDGNTRLEILHAPAELAGKGRADDSGLVIRLHWQGWKILFTGDAGFITETRLLQSGRDLRADVIITGRNCHDFTGHEEFYRQVAPRAIITSNASFPVHERLPQGWLQSLQSQGIRVFDQQQTGAVTLTLNHGKLVLTPMLNTSQAMTIQR